MDYEDAHKICSVEGNPSLCSRFNPMSEMPPDSTRLAKLGRRAMALVPLMGIDPAKSVKSYEIAHENAREEIGRFRARRERGGSALQIPGPNCATTVECDLYISVAFWIMRCFVVWRVHITPKVSEWCACYV